jgi:hypothetical protein
MRQAPVAEPRTAWDLPVKERWFCRWCYGWTELGHDPHEVSRLLSYRFGHTPVGGRAQTYA